jgi:hypothetical protein
VTDDFKRDLLVQDSFAFLPDNSPNPLKSCQMGFWIGHGR